jgi:hypothetical protein
LYDAFERRRRRYARLSRRVRGNEAAAEELVRGSRGKITLSAARDRVGYHVVWSRWSQCYDDASEAADSLLRCRPTSLADLLMMFSALEWLLLTDAVIVDHTAEHQVRLFGRRLRRFVAGRQTSATSSSSRL